MHFLYILKINSLCFAKTFSYQVKRSRAVICLSEIMGHASIHTQDLCPINQHVSLFAYPNQSAGISMTGAGQLLLRSVCVRMGFSIHTSKCLSVRTRARTRPNQEEIKQTYCLICPRLTFKPFFHSFINMHLHLIASIHAINITMSSLPHKICLRLNQKLFTKRIALN